MFQDDGEVHGAGVQCVGVAGWRVVKVRLGIHFVERMGLWWIPMVRGME